MKYLYSILISLILFSFVTSGNSQTISDEMIGTWKVDSISESSDNLKIEIYYEFTTDSMYIYGNINDEPLSKITIGFKIKSEDEEELIIEAVHPNTGQTGEFKITVDGSKMVMIDPDERKFLLTKQ